LTSYRKFIKNPEQPLCVRAAGYALPRRTFAERAVTHSEQVLRPRCPFEMQFRVRRMIRPAHVGRPWPAGPPPRDRRFFSVHRAESDPRDRKRQEKLAPDR